MEYKNITMNFVIVSFQSIVVNQDQNSDLKKINLFQNKVKKKSNPRTWLLSLVNWKLLISTLV